MAIVVPEHVVIMIQVFVNCIGIAWLLNDNIKTHRALNESIRGLREVLNRT